MEAHNFPEGEKVRHFCMMLIGETRLWYELLAQLDNDLPTLQNKFRWQYSKIGNTPKQLFGGLLNLMRTQTQYTPMF